MENYVDIHSHILPGLDDGAKSAAESLEMLKMGYRQGIKTIIATPHYGKYSTQYDIETVKKVADLMQRDIKQDCPDLKILLGNEIYYSYDVVMDLKAGKAMTLAGSDYVLVEFDFNSDYAKIIAAIRELKLAGYKPIIAHAERYLCIFGDTEKAKEIHSEGALIQVNAGMLLNPPSKTDNWSIMVSKTHHNLIDIFEEAAWKLLKADQVDFIASDTHDSTYRRPVIGDAFEVIETELGNDIVDTLINNAKNII